MKISGVMTQGAPEEDSWVSKFTLSFSDNGRDKWFDYLDHDGQNTVTFRGNSDRHSISEGVLRQPVTARYVRVKPVEWNNKIAMRIDIVGCKLRYNVNFYSLSLIDRLTGLKSKRICKKSLGKIST